ncbi:hypothetical protein [Nonlabens tegetincola]|uniref:hypothetical protein n=1 Tax=Nonlabens tegetincola TaxID=323273 RepID=UPI0030C84B62
MKFIDFAPKTVSKTFWKGTTYETLDDVMPRVEEWLRKNYSFEIINVETIVQQFPRGKELNSKASYHLNLHSGITISMQIIRVWYKD